MSAIEERIKIEKQKGYDGANATAKACQDIVLEAIANSFIKDNITIKGGIVMREISKNIRRATQDMDLDFIRYPLSNEFIVNFVSKLNVLEDYSIRIVGKIEDLKQQDYKGKRVYLEVSDASGLSLQTKLDLGVHTHLDMEQGEYYFDTGEEGEGVYLHVNSKEQIVVEKLKSLLRFGIVSTRYKDVFDIYYLIDKININKFVKYFEEYVLRDNTIAANDMEDAFEMVKNIFSNKNYLDKLIKSDKNWLGLNLDNVLNGIIEFLKELI